jgi:glutamate-ammonia-ligase adenylyltransferase
MEARAGFIRATRRIAATLGEPGARATSSAPTFACGPMRARRRSASRWRRRSGITRPRAGPGSGRPISRRARRRATSRRGRRFLETLQPFVWRRHLDFAMVQDTMDMRRRIREHKGLIRRDGTIPLDGHNIKLGAGGIREIEFFAQTRQLVAGGRDPSCGTGARSRRWRRWRGPTGSPARRPANWPSFMPITGRSSIACR